LEEAKVEFTEIDIEQDRKAAEFVREVNRGMYSVPTIVFPDGSMLTEPSYAELKLKLRQQRILALATANKAGPQDAENPPADPASDN